MRNWPFLVTFTSLDSISSSRHPRRAGGCPIIEFDIRREGIFWYSCRAVAAPLGCVQRSVRVLRAGAVRLALTAQPPDTASPPWAPDSERDPCVRGWTSPARHGAEGARSSQQCHPLAQAMSGVGGFGGRWLCLSAAIVATFAGTGVGYAWGVFSPSLKSTLKLSQTQLMIVANAPTYAVSLPPMAFIPGWVYDWGGDRRGAAISMILAAIGLGGGYLLMYATAERLLPMPSALEEHLHPSSWSVALLSVGNVMAGYGASFSTVACMVVIVKNFPHRRGTVVGIVKCITGLSGGMYAQIYNGFLAPQTLSFVLMAAVSNLVLNFSMALFLPVVPADPHERNLDLRLSLAMAIVILLTVGILAAACAAHFFPQNDDHHGGSWSGSSADEDASVRDSFALGCPSTERNV